MATYGIAHQFSGRIDRITPYLVITPTTEPTSSRFSYSEYLATHAYARNEANPELRTEYLHYANALAEIAKKLFEEPKPNPTTKMFAKV